MKKRIYALFLVMVMVLSMLGGCKNNGNETTDTNVTPTTAGGDTEGDNSAEPTPATPENEVTGNIDAEDAFVVYCWNTDVQNNVLKYFNEFYPEYADRIVYVNTGGTNWYQDKVDTILSDPTNKLYPDLIALEADYIMKYTDSDATLPVSELGITDADMTEMYPYTVELAKDSAGQIKALSWQATPGAMMYRRSLAKKYLGTDDPAAVQEYFKDWNTMIETGKKIIADSNGETKLFSGIDDVKRVYTAARQNPWYDENDKIQVEQIILDYFDYAKQLYDLGLTNNTTQWTDEWNANVKSDSTFAYMGCTWFLHWTLKSHAGEAGEDGSTYGDWAMCAGPQNYYWGGTWLAATKDCSDKELAGKIIKAACCEKEVMKQICSVSLDYVNNKAAIAELSKEGKGTFDFLGGQDFLSYFSPLAEQIQVPPMRGEDFHIYTAMDDQVSAYAQGKKDKDTAINDFKDYVVSLYPYLSK